MIASSHVPMKASGTNSDDSSDVRFTYSSSKKDVEVSTPTFTENQASMNRMSQSAFQTPKCEPAVLASVNPTESKSQLSNEYFQVSKKVSSNLVREDNYVCSWLTAVKFQ